MFAVCALDHIEQGRAGAWRPRGEAGQERVDALGGPAVEGHAVGGGGVANDLAETRPCAFEGEGVGVDVELGLEGAKAAVVAIVFSEHRLRERVHAAL